MDNRFALGGVIFLSGVLVSGETYRRVEMQPHTPTTIRINAGTLTANIAVENVSNQMVSFEPLREHVLKVERDRLVVQPIELALPIRKG
jgi:hypothetical protein